LLYRPEDFEPLTEEPWDEARIRSGIREIVADTDAALRGPKLLWRAEDWDRWRATSPLKALFVGAAGVLWALDDLRERGHAETRLELGELGLQVLARYRARPDLARWTDLPEARDSSLLSGEAGILLVAFRLAPTQELADALHARVRDNVHNEADEIMWGSPGTLIAARLMVAWTGEDRWRAAWDESAEALLARRDTQGLWTQLLHGQTHRFLGPVHGLTGNALSVSRLLDDARRVALQSETAAILERTAFVEDGLANWPPVERPALASANGDIRVQWCHGAPGIVCAAASYLDQERLLAGAELTWRAGGHGEAKGAGICHGTAGNGYALLKAFAQTATSAGSSGHVASPCTRSRRYAVGAPSWDGVATRSGRETSASRSTSPIASTHVLRTRFSTPD
jgi:lanthionine synthetase-like protein